MGVVDDMVTVQWQSKTRERDAARGNSTEDGGGMRGKEGERARQLRPLITCPGCRGPHKFKHRIGAPIRSKHRDSTRSRVAQELRVNISLLIAQN